MGKEIDLLINYPRANRDISARAENKTDEVRSIAKKFGKEFFDGDRKYGYGGFNYNSKFWKNVIPTFTNEYNLRNGSKLLDVGCAKGFMLYDFLNYLPGLKVSGIDISKYAIENSMEEVKNCVEVADAKKLPFDDNSFDVVISINTIHNLPINELILALKEIERVSKGKSFITVDAFRNEEEKKKMLDWNLTAQTILSVEEWLKLFKSSGYTGDYYWFMP
jgi:ubiquinone/menaquinone biosynthesis C-methylase UbiE